MFQLRRSVIRLVAGLTYGNSHRQGIVKTVKQSSHLLVQAAAAALVWCCCTQSRHIWNICSMVQPDPEVLVMSTDCCPCGINYLSVSSLGVCISSSWGSVHSGIGVRISLSTSLRTVVPTLLSRRHQQKQQHRKLHRPHRISNSGITVTIHMTPISFLQPRRMSFLASSSSLPLS